VPFGECEPWRHARVLPDSGQKLTTRFVAITPLSDSWDAKAHRSCNRLSESLLARPMLSINQILEAPAEKPRSPARHEGRFPKRASVRCISRKVRKCLSLWRFRGVTRPHFASAGQRRSPQLRRAHVGSFLLPQNSCFLSAASERY
jgi:hypothetical protein